MRRIRAGLLLCLMLACLPMPSSPAAAAFDTHAAAHDRAAAPAGTGVSAAAGSTAAASSDATTSDDDRSDRRPKRASYSWERLERRYPGSFVTRGPAGRKRIALTFDDVPDPRFTPQVLETLSRHRVRATFFVVGSRARQQPALVKRMIREGHLIGNHSDTHVLFTERSVASFGRQIDRTDQTLYRLTGIRPRFIRPPYGAITSQQVAWARKRGYIVANWNVDSVDWRNTPSAAILANIKKSLQPGSIILLHAGGGRGQDLSGTIEALPKLIARLKRQGYTFVTLDELLGQRGTR